MTHAAGNSKRVMIVDDDPILRGMAASTLRHVGLEVVEADCGEEALRQFDEAAVDLVLLDVMMPDLDGYAVCQRMRERDCGTTLPILMLTGLNDTESIEQAFQSGATDFIAKPINWALLSQRVRYSLRAGAAMAQAVRIRERLERAHRIANMGSWELRDEGSRLHCSRELLDLFGATLDNPAPCDPEAFLARVCEPDRERVRRARLDAVESGKQYQATYRIERYDGTTCTVFEQAAVVVDAGKGRIVEGITQDISERVEAERRIVQLANYDTLTGLSNQRFFDEISSRALARSARLGASCALLHVDIDRFKTVNDAFGHVVGDEVLRTIAGRLQASIRTSDVATLGAITSDSLVARVRANAYTLLLLDAGSDQQISGTAARLHEVIAEPIYVNGHEIVVTSSIGIALYPRDSDSVSGLARCAEQAAYAAKAAGRARHRFFDEEMNARASMRLARESELRAAIAGTQLRVHYQPKVDAIARRLVGAEALVRWLHPERGMIAPGEFIPLAEETGLIDPLTDWVLEAVCADLQRRASRGLKQVPVSVNLAASSFAHEGLIERLGGLMSRYGLQPDCLVLEVTESLLMEDVAGAVVRLTQLRDRGFGVSLDDFGTGYSSLGYLKRFPVDELKIDRSFVLDVCRGPNDGVLAASIIALAKTFGLRVVAEGVETLEQAEFLSARGCRFHQGFLYARPMPGDEFDRLLASGDGASVATPHADGRDSGARIASVH